MIDWLLRLLQPAASAQGAAPGGLLSPATVPGQGMMAGVAGFDPSNPGAYGNRTAGDADLGGYGGSPKLPDAKSNPAAANLAMQAGMGLMAAGAPRQSWQPSPMQMTQPYRPTGETTLPDLRYRRPRGLLDSFMGPMTAKGMH